MKRVFAIVALGLILAGGITSCKNSGHLCDSYGNKSSNVDNQAVPDENLEELPS